MGLWSPVVRYMRWLHTGWPAGMVEKLPEVSADGETSVAGVRVVGDLTGIPLLKFSSDSGARAVQAILRESDFSGQRGKRPEVLDLAIVGAGVSGVAAAMEAQKAGLKYKLYEASQAFSTIVNFPKAKPIFTYPNDMTPAGDLQFSATIKEALVAEIERQRSEAGVEITLGRIEKLQKTGEGILLHHAGGEQTRALRVIVAIGRSGNFRKLGCKGEELDKVYNRLHDPKDYCGKRVLVVGGGDSALEAAIALAGCAAHVTLSYRKPDLSRPKPENVEKLMTLVKDPSAPVAVEQPTSERVTTGTTIHMRPKGHVGSVDLKLGTALKEVTADQVVLKDTDGQEIPIENDAVFAMIGREAPLDFFRKSGISIRGEWRVRTWATFVSMIVGMCFLYHWKSFPPVKKWFAQADLFPHNIPGWIQSWGEAAREPAHLWGTLALAAGDPAFYYSLAYTLCILLFGYKRIKRRQTPYVTRQTLTLMSVQIIPLFLLPFILLPWMAHNGCFGDRVVVEILGPQKRAQWKALMEKIPAQPPSPQKSEPLEALEWKLARRAKYDYALWLARNELLEGGLLPKAMVDWKYPKFESASGKAAVLVDGELPSKERWRRRTEINFETNHIHILDYDKPYDVLTKKTGWVADTLFPVASYDPQGREYWRSAGLILAWPLFIWNVFTSQPIWTWLLISLIQTFVLIPLLIYRFGKGAYCGWICSCGALAETMGDTHRHKMPHGPLWNRLNMIGQVFLASALVLLVLRVWSWISPQGVAADLFAALLNGIPVFNYAYIVDLWWAGIIGVSLYFHFSGRVWCRFACPLAALMHIYARFSRFRIFSNKKKCISCNVCTSVCHQGIDIMNFANKGVGMQDPQCVRCSACVQQCPTGVLNFGYLDKNEKPVLENLAASPVQMREGSGGVQS